MAPEAEFFKPGNNISWLVVQFEAIHSYNSNPLIDKFVPQADTSLVFHFGNLPRIMKPAIQPLPSFFMAPLCPTANSIMIEGKTETFIATCKPTVLSRVLGMSMIPGKLIYLPISEPLFRPVWEEMKQQANLTGRIEVFTRFFNKLHPGEYIPDETDLMYDKILNNSISTPLHKIIGDFALGERTVQRRFRERLGITPKKLERIIKINYLWNRINSNGNLDYQDLVFMGNYYDQTHFIKDFKSITGETPDHFFRRDLNVAKILSGIEV